MAILMNDSARSMCDENEPDYTADNKDYCGSNEYFLQYFHIYFPYQNNVDGDRNVTSPDFLNAIIVTLKSKVLPWNHLTIITEKFPGVGYREPADHLPHSRYALFR